MSTALESKLMHRSTKEELADRAILDDSMLAPRLHGQAISLQSKLIRKMDRDDLVRLGILTADTNVANSLHGARNALEGRLARRQSQADLSQRGMLTGNSALSKALAPAAHAINKKLARRPSVDMLKQRGIMNQYSSSQMPQEMIARAMANERSRKSKRVDQLLQSRPDREKLKYFQNFNSHEVARSLHGAGHNVAKMLKRRPSVDQLASQGILRNPHMNDQMAEQARQLGYTQRASTLNNFLDHRLKEQRGKEARAKIGLPDNLATSDDIKRIMDQNAILMQAMTQMTQQMSVLQATCSELLRDREQAKAQMADLARAQQAEILAMREQFIETMKTQPPKKDTLEVQQVPRSPSFRSDFKQFQEELRSMKQGAREYLINEKKAMAQKEAAMQAHMIEQEIQLARLQGEYEVTISSRPAGIKYDSTDSGRNLCVKAVLKGSMAEQSGVMPGDVVVSLRNYHDNRVIRCENKDAEETLGILRQKSLPLVVKFRKHEAHLQLINLWRRKRELIEAVPQAAHVYQSKSDAVPQQKPQHQRKTSNLIHSGGMAQSTPDLDMRKREMEQALMNLKQQGNIDPIVRAFEEMDVNHNGDLNQKEFVGGLYKIGLGEGLSDSQMIHAFRMMDEDDSGYIDFEEFEDFLKHSHHDKILQVVQKHIRERITLLLMEARGQRVRTQSEAHRQDIVAKQQAQADERAQMMAMIAAKKQALSQAEQRQRTQSADGNNPKSWREAYSDEDAMKIEILAQNIERILKDQKSWQYVIATVRSKIPNLELAIAKELYPLIQNREILETKDVISRTLYIVDVLHSQVAPPEKKGVPGADPMAVPSVDVLVDASRRYSTTEVARTHMKEVNLRTHGGLQQDEEDSSEEYYYDQGPPGNKQDRGMEKISSTKDIEAQRVQANIPPELLQQFASQLQSNDQSPSAFDEEEREENEQAPPPSVADPTSPSIVPDTMDTPPHANIDPRKSERLMIQTPKAARPSVELGDLPEKESVGGDDMGEADKRAPETPREPAPPEEEVKREIPPTEPPKEATDTAPEVTE